MKKLIVRSLLAVILVLVIALGGLYFYRNSLIRSAVETQANSSLGVKTTLGAAHLGLFGGTLDLDDLKIGSPAGYKADHMFTLNGLDLGVNYSDLRKDPVRVGKITIDKPKAILESVDGKFNFQALMDQLGGGTQPKPDDKTSQPVKMIIDELTVKDATVEVRHPLIPQPITVNIPSVTLKQIGNGEGAQNGAAIKDVVGATMSALAASAANSPQLKDVSGMLKAQAHEALAKAQKELAQQVQSITGDITKTLEKSGLPTDQLKDLTGGKDPTKSLNDNLTNLLNGKKKDEKKK